MMSSGIQLKRGIKLAAKTTYPQDFNAPGTYDLCQTPSYAVEPLLKYVPKHWRIWESACGEGYLKRAIERRGYKVTGSDIQDGRNYFYWPPKNTARLLFDCQITNPPYSLKIHWVERAYELGLPWCLLLPVESMGVGALQRMFNAYGVEVIYLDKRVDFKTANTSFEDSSAYFPTAWYTWGLEIGKQAVFETLVKRPEAQLIMRFDND